MTTISQFFPTSSGAGETNTSAFRIVMETSTIAIPAGICYVAYTALGAGNCSANASCAGGNGGGFSHFDGALSCSSTFDVVATVGVSNGNSGCPSCVAGFSTGVICATGAVSGGIGCGVGGLINTKGGCTKCNFSGGSGAGGGRLRGNAPRAGGGRHSAIVHQPAAGAGHAGASLRPRLWRDSGDGLHRRRQRIHDGAVSRS